MSVAPWFVICGVRSFDWAYRIRHGRQVIGRAAECDIRIDHPTVSRRHAEVRFDGESLEISDLKSSNGTCVNGERIRRAKFRMGDSITLGRVMLDVVATVETIHPSIDEDEATEKLPLDGSDTVEAAADLLSPTDCKVMKLLLDGLSEKAVAKRLRMSEHTVHWRIHKRVYKALGVHSRSELFTSFLKNGGA